MRKSLLVSFSLLVSIAVGIFLVGPKLIGMGVSALTIENMLATLPPQARSQVDLQTTSIESGWFNSIANVSLILTSPLAEPVNIGLQYRIDHGPIVNSSSGTSLALAAVRIIPDPPAPELQAELAALPFELPEFDIEMLVNFNRSMNLRLQMGPIDYQENADAFEFAGMRSDLSIAADQSGIFNMNIGALRATSNQTSFYISNIDIASSSDLLADPFAPSNALVQIGEMNSPSPFDFRFDDFRVESAIDTTLADPALLQMRQRMAIASLEGDVPVQSFDIEIELDRFDPQILDRYYELASGIQNQLSPANASAGNTVSAVGQELIVLLIQNPLDINVSIDASAYDGSHTASLQLQWDGLPGVTDVMVMDLNAALAATNLEIAIDLDTEAFVRSPMGSALDSYVQAELVRLENGRVLFDLTLINSTISLNGVETTLDDLL